MWLGGPEPEEVKYHWKTAKRHNPDWEFITHNEDNLDEFSISKKYLDLHPSYSFKSDLIRFEALYKYGGFYIDTDVEVIRSFDNLCNFTGVIAGYEEYSKRTIGTATIGASVGSDELLKALYYIGEGAIKETKSEKGFIYEVGSRGFGPTATSSLWKNNKNAKILEKEAFHILGGRKINFKTLDLSKTYSVHKSFKSWS